MKYEKTQQFEKHEKLVTINTDVEVELDDECSLATRLIYDHNLTSNH